MRMRYGRGFTKAELKEAKVPLRLARTIGISFDKRRRNSSDPVFRANVNRVKEYRSRLILFPKRGRMQLGDAPRKLRTKAKQLKKARDYVIPIKRKQLVFEKPRLVKRSEWKSNAYLKLRRARLQPRIISRKKREAAAAAAGETAKKGKKGKKGAKVAPAKKAAAPAEAQDE
jgi:large subunit ribosomal protein L13e